MPFPDCSITTHSDELIQDGLIRLGDNRSKEGGTELQNTEMDDEEGEREEERDNDESNRICQDPFLMSQMEGHLKRRLAARLNEICGDNMICEIDDLQAECRHVINTDGGNQRQSVAAANSTVTAIVDDDDANELNQLNQLPPMLSRVKRKKREVSDLGLDETAIGSSVQQRQFQQQMTFNLPISKTSGNSSNGGGGVSNNPVTLEFRFKISSEFFF